MSAPLTPRRSLVLDLGTSLEGSKQFRVTVIEWLSHVIDVGAEDAAAAQSLAEQVWSRFGREAFRAGDQGIDGFHVDEITGGAS